jgi:hypothetical protein
MPAITECLEKLGPLCSNYFVIGSALAQKRLKGLSSSNMAMASQQPRTA